MRNQKGITLISLVITIILMVILAVITSVSSINSYNQMRYETFKAQFEEIQRATDEICTDYQLYKNDESITNMDAEDEGTTSEKNYKTYFQYKYEEVPTALSEIWDEELLKTISDVEEKYGDDFHDHAGYTFYFDKSDMENYLGLKGINTPFIIDFSTRYVYSVIGYKNPENDEIVYTLSDKWHADENEDKNKSNLMGVTIENFDRIGSIEAQQINVELSLQRDATGKKYEITNVYYCIVNDDSEETENENWIAVSSPKISGDTILFTLNEEGKYKFRVKDRSGATFDTEDFRSTTFSKRLLNQITKANYGQKVAYSVDISGTKYDDWNIFYKDSNNVYIIYGEKIDFRDGIDASNISSNINTSELGNRFLFSGIDNSGNSLFNTSHNNYKNVARMLQTDNWRDFVKENYANYAIATPTLDMFVNSWNRVHSSSDQKLKCIATKSIGYTIGFVENDTQNNTCDLKSKSTNPLYLNGYDYYLAAPSSDNQENIYYVSSTGTINSEEFRQSLDIGLRPVVSLKSDIIGEYIEGIWKLDY